MQLGFVCLHALRCDSDRDASRRLPDSEGGLGGPSQLANPADASGPGWPLPRRSRTVTNDASHHRGCRP